MGDIIQVKSIFCDLLGERIRSLEERVLSLKSKLPSADPEGGTGGPEPPPWKITSYMGFAGNKQLDPPPLEKVGPPPPWKMLDPLWKNDRFL